MLQSSNRKSPYPSTLLQNHLSRLRAPPTAIHLQYNSLTTWNHKERDYLHNCWHQMLWSERYWVFLRINCYRQLWTPLGCNLSSSVGMLPFKLLYQKSRFSMFFMFDKVDGIEPLKLLWDKFNPCRSINFPIPGRIWHTSLLQDKSIPCMSWGCYLCSCNLCFLLWNWLGFLYHILCIIYSHFFRDIFEGQW